jgi:glycosyltransferase involved in cell wall biosynthesis
MNKLRILMFCPQFRPVIGGAERQAEKLAIALAAAGCHVSILTPRIDSDSPDVEEILGVRIERFPMTDLSRRWPFPGIALLNIPIILYQVTRAVRCRLPQADLLHTHIASLPTLGAILAARLAGKPAICKAAMADQRSDLGEMEKQGPMGMLVAWAIRQFTPYWVATTRAVEEALIRTGIMPGRIVQIPNGVGLPKERQIRKDPVRRFLYMGRLSTNIQRDVPTLIAAFDKLAEQLPDAELALVGGGDLLEATRTQVTGCSGRQRIYVPGFDAPDQWLAWADCFVLPSRREGLSNALIEAMAEGLPCIANDIPPNREVLADGLAGVLVPVDDVEALTEAIRRMATEDTLAQAMRAAAYLRAKQHYGIESVAIRYLDLYYNLLNKNNPA